MAIPSRSIRPLRALKGWMCLWGLCPLLVLLSCSGDSSSASYGSLVRISLLGADPTLTRAVLTVNEQDQQGQTQMKTAEFTSGPFDVLGVTFPPGTVAVTTYDVQVYRDTCLLGSGTVTQNIDHDGTYDVTVQLSPPPLVCGAPAVRVIVQVVNGLGGTGTVVTPGKPDISCGSKCEQVYPVGAPVTLQAIASSGVFQSWSGGCMGSTPLCTPTLSQAGDVVVQAVFAATGGCRGWCEEPSGVTDNLYSVWGSGPLNVYAVGANGTIVKWDGLAWTKQPSVTTQALRGVTFPRGGGSYIMVGDGGTILGQSGKLPDPSGGANLNAVAEDSASDVFIVGDNGTTLKGSTTGNFGVKKPDGGGGNPPSAQAGKKLHAIGFAPSGDNFLLVGDQGYNVRRSTFFGSDVFSNTASGTAQNLNGVFFGTKSIFAVGAAGTIVQRGSPDLVGNYSNWNVQTSSVSVALQGIWGTPDNKLFAVGDTLTILYWDGSVWSKVPAPTLVSKTTPRLNAIWGTSATNVYAVGDGGTILHYLP